jgi:5-(carboxyamino)imidazole ribonucleotide mutase
LRNRGFAINLGGSMPEANLENLAPQVGIIMGSQSDMAAMEPCMQQLDALGVPYEVKVASAHRKPLEVHEWAASAADRGLRVIVAAAGKAAHLGGVVAAYTPLPVIAVPMKTSDLGGLDSLLSMVQMPSGVPVACVAINGAKNAAILAVQMMGAGTGAADAEMRAKIVALKEEMAQA